MKVKNTFRRGFTLIELMIVIVILGILMGTILPRLTGAQARARDTARIADLTNIAQALEVYFNDEGSYPDADDLSSVSGACVTGSTTCLCLDPRVAAASRPTATALGSYLKGGSVPLPASEAQQSVGCVGSYYYKPLTRAGVGNAAYALVSDVETWQTANYLLAADTEIAATVYQNGTDGVADLVNPTITAADDAANALRTVYVVIP